MTVQAKNLRPLFISARRGSWRMLDWHANESDGRYQAIRKQVLERDNYTCVYCGFRSLRYQHLNHINHDHGNSSANNVVTACPLCHLCSHLGLAGILHAGVIIYLPEISQADLNNIARAIFIALSNGGANEQWAEKLYAALLSRSGIIEEIFGTGTSNPASFGQAFGELENQEYASRKERLPGLRLLPRAQAFGPEIAYWATEPSAYGSFADADWGGLVPLPEEVLGEVEEDSSVSVDPDAETFGDMDEEG